MYVVGFARIPDKEKDLPLIPDEVTGKAYSPRRALEEVRAGTDLGRRLQEKIAAGKLTPEVTLKEIAKHRLKKTLEDLPEGWGIATLGKVYRKKEIMKLIEYEKAPMSALIEQEIKRMKGLMRVG